MQPGSTMTPQQLHMAHAYQQSRMQQLRMHQMQQQQNMPPRHLLQMQQAQQNALQRARLKIQNEGIPQDWDLQTHEPYEQTLARLFYSEELQALYQREQQHLQEEVAEQYAGPNLPPNWTPLQIQQYAMMRQAQHRAAELAASQPYGPYTFNWT
jgi:hypothetical protein